MQRTRTAILTSLSNAGLAILAVVVLTLAPAPSANAAPCAGFTDVDDTSQFCPDVTWMKNRGITLGCGAGTTYCPYEPVSRLAMAVFFNRLASKIGPPVLVDSTGKVVGTPEEINTSVMYRGPHGLAKLFLLHDGGGRVINIGVTSGGSNPDRFIYHDFFDWSCSVQAYRHVRTDNPNVSSETSLRFTQIVSVLDGALQVFYNAPDVTPQELHPVFNLYENGGWWLRAKADGGVCVFTQVQANWLYVPVTRGENLSVLFTPPFHWE